MKLHAVVIAGVLASGTALGGPEKIKFPSNYLKASITIDTAGEYNYICGLHPSMKGVIEVK